MTMNAEWLEIDGERVVQGLQAARETLDDAQGDVVLDFSAVRRDRSQCAQGDGKAGRFSRRESRQGRACVASTSTFTKC